MNTEIKSKTNGLPSGYYTSKLTPELEQSAVDVMNAYNRWLTGGDLTNLEDMQVEWAEEGFNRETDIHLVLSPQDQVVGYADVWDGNSMHVKIYAYGMVLPEHMGRGIGSYLANWIVERARQNVSRAPEGARVVLHQGINSANQAACDLLTAHGFSPVRQSYRMRIDFDQPPAAPALPEGIVIRGIIPGKEERDGLFAAYDSFHDHWGFVEEPFESYLKRWTYFFENDRNYDPSLFFVALDGDEVAGVSICWPKIEEDPDMAWVGTLGVRRNWRKRGLGLALLQHSFHEFYKRGKPRAGLGVDASSLTGATRLYERAGMHVWRKFNTFEYELRPGKDLMKQSI